VEVFPSSEEMPESWFKAGPEEVGLEGPALSSCESTFMISISISIFNCK
jgi:hypothetical protein